jgi:predicted AlkP superfamily phosphohydrolase/phosphomutase
MAEGVFGSLQSTIPPMTAPAWTSFMTGKNPGKHGLYDWIYRRRDGYDVLPVTAADCHEPTLWSLLSHASRRVCVINVPMTYPPTPVSGVLISGLPAPSTQVPITYPPDLLTEIEAEVGEYLLYPDPGQAYSDHGVDAFLDNLYRTTDARLRVFEYLRAREQWDFCMLVLNGTDTVQHAMWKFMSPEHPLHDPDKQERYGDAILYYFQRVDGALAQIVASLDEDTTLVLMSDHGFGPFHKFIHLNNWLRQQGWLQIKRTPMAMFKSWLFDLGFTPMRIYDLLMEIGLGVLKREVVRGRGQGLLKKLFLSFDDVDWPRTAAYGLGNVGQIRLNLRGREPQGLIEPGSAESQSVRHRNGVGQAQYEATRDEIMACLMRLRDPETGERVVEAVYRREDVYWGPYVEEAADILFIPTRMEYFGFGEYEFGSREIIESMKRGISGTHRLNGMALLWGNKVRTGARLQDAEIVDLAPTILHLMGEPVPTDMDGRVLTEALAAGGSEIRHIDPGGRGGECQKGPARPTAPLADEEADVVRERLRGLGYVA